MYDVTAIVWFAGYEASSGGRMSRSELSILRAFAASAAWTSANPARVHIDFEFTVRTSVTCPW